MTTEIATRPIIRALSVPLRRGIFVDLLEREAPAADQPVLDDLVDTEWLLPGLIHLADQFQVVSVKFGFSDPISCTAQQSEKLGRQALVFKRGGQVIC
jgi:hypothetical protein